MYKFWLKRTYGMYKFRLKRTYSMYKFRLKRLYGIDKVQSFDMTKYTFLGNQYYLRTHFFKRKQKSKISKLIFF